MLFLNPDPLTAVVQLVLILTVLGLVGVCVCDFHREGRRRLEADAARGRATSDERWAGDL